MTMLLVIINFERHLLLVPAVESQTKMAAPGMTAEKIYVVTVVHHVHSRLQQALTKIVAVVAKSRICSNEIRQVQKMDLLLLCSWEFHAEYHESVRLANSTLTTS